MEPRWRIGVLARRVGLSTQLLRVWERRYGLFQPERSTGGYRLYSAADERRVHRVLALQKEGHSTAEAARLALEADVAAQSPASTVRLAARAPSVDELDHIALRLRESLDARDEPGAQRALDTVFALTDVETATVRVILPVLRDIGDAWARGELCVAAEHYSSNLLQGRLLALARGWDSGIGPLAVLACAPGELHAIGLIAFGLGLRLRGWRIAYLGPSTPLDSLAGWLRGHHPDVVVIAAAMSDRLLDAEADLRELARRHRLFLGGAGASLEFAVLVGATALSADPSAAADEIDSLARERHRGPGNH